MKLIAAPVSMVLTAAVLAGFGFPSAVLAQGSTRDPGPLTESHIILAHRSHVEGLAGVVETLRRLERGEHPRVLTEGRASCNYTHPGWTDYRKYRKILKQLWRERG